MKNLLKTIVITTYIVIVLTLAVATIIEKINGTTTIYGTWWFCMLWGILAVAGFVYMIRQKLQRRPVAFCLHLALIVILIGALVTHIFGKQGTMHLRYDETCNTYLVDGSLLKMPFDVELVGFRVDMYPGTMSPMDYVSNVLFDGQQEASISMNNIAQYAGYRFYQSGYDPDRQGAYLSVSHDPWGIAITYIGYALLFISFALMLILPNEGFRRQMKAMDKGAILAFVLLLLPTLADAKSNNPKTLPDEVAKEYCSMYTYYNGRICPLQTVARTFTTKIYGKPTYKGLSAEQVYTGWLFFAPDWLDEPFVKLKGAARTAVGIDGKYASYTDFFANGHFKLDDLLTDIYVGKDVDGSSDILAANEKANLLRMLFEGELTKIYPVRDSNNVVSWYHQNDKLPRSLDPENYGFIRMVQDHIAQLAFDHKYDDVIYTISKIKKYQRNAANDLLPSDARFEAEMMYNRLSSTRPLAMALATLGFLVFFYYVIRWMNERRPHRAMTIAINIVMALVVIYQLVIFSLRWFVSGHIPMTNGYETMQFMSLCVVVITIVMQRHFVLVVPFGLLLAGLTMMVSMFGESNPQITNLMPVLASPLLSIHVCTIMIAYSLLAFTMFNGVTAIVVNASTRYARGKVESLADISRLLLYPALCFLSIGIFVGAIWANQSWGRYWGWDPKEVWALITLLIYAIPLHSQSLPIFRRPIALHIFLAAAFLTVLMTYFGVNFLLGGMHSYA
ncbi:MAG: cytochrome c biogenesis protein CcsA [Marinilabiliaceae bacterium]|nr:cytochrome c biogenesis protein CcsA [Marinilabiliaceae bacterium]